MQLTSTSFTSPHLTPLQRLVALQLIRVRERAGLSRAQMAQRTGFSPPEVEIIETGVRALDIAEVRAWCRAAGTSLVEFARELDGPLSALLDREEEARANQAALQAPNICLLRYICLLRFAPGALPELLTVENAPGALQSLLGTTQVRVFATGSPATLGLSAAASTDEDSARGADDQEACSLLHPTAAFLVVVGTFDGAEFSPSAPRNQGLEWAPLAAWVPLCPRALDLALASDWGRLHLGSLSPLQLEFALDRFAPRLSHGALVDILSLHSDGPEWMAAWSAGE